jgi:hypothetical protein
MQRGIHMRKIVLLAVAALIVTSIGAWLGVRALTPKSAVAGSTDDSPVMTTGAKGLPTMHYDDFDIVVH